MLKHSFLLLFTSLTCLYAQAQPKYDFSILKSPYQELSSGISANGSTMWDEEAYKVPIGFSYKFGDKYVDSLGIMGATVFGDDTANIINCFWAVMADYCDRGIHGSGTTSSPIRYKTTGTAGSRIFKAEAANAGFFEEYQQHNTNNDFVNVQIWLYEGSNIAELRFGPSKISHATDYFYANGQPIVGYIERWHWDSTYSEKSYSLIGSPNSPSYVVDVISTTGLNYMPSDSTIYRFTPHPTGIITTAVLEQLGIYNTICKSELIITNPEKREYAYYITGINGQLISKQGKSNDEVNKVSLDGFTNGQYVIKLLSANGSTYHRFIKTQE